MLHFRNYVAGQIHYPRRNRVYSVSQMLLALVHPILLGLDRIETAALLHSDETFQYLTGLQSFPDPQISCDGLTAIQRVQPGEPVAGNPLGGF